MRTLYLVLLSMRPRQWLKNIFIFPALLFSQNLFVLPMVLKTIMAFIIFCLLSGSLYIFNDLMDVEQDRIHPEKSHRPIASGKLAALVAGAATMIVGMFSIGVSFFLDSSFAMILVGYLTAQVAYSVLLKKIVIIDIFSIAAGFFLRVMAGAEVINVPVSSWLLICTLFVSLFLAIGKRRHELLLLGDSARQHREVLADYSVHLLDQMVGVVTAGTVLSYSLYTLSEETIKKFHTNKLWLTVPIVLFGIFRYLYCVYKKDGGGRPEKILSEDRPFLLSVLLYAIVVIAILYY